MAERTERLSFIEKAGYSLGDAAANFVFMTMILFQLNFYTDTMGLAAASAGTMHRRWTSANPCPLTTGPW